MTKTIIRVQFGGLYFYEQMANIKYFYSIKHRHHNAKIIYCFYLIKIHYKISDVLFVLLE